MERNLMWLPAFVQVQN